MSNILRKRIFVSTLFIVYLLILIKLIFFKEQIGSITYQHISYDRSSYFYMVRYKIIHSNLIPGRTISSFIKNLRDEKKQDGHYDKTELEFTIQNIVGNILLFIPMGLLLPIVIRLRWSWSRMLLTLLASSLCCEIIQVISVSGFFDVDDIILNTLGGLVGYVLFIKTKFYFSKKETESCH